LEANLLWICPEHFLVQRSTQTAIPKNEVDSLIYRAGLFGQWLVAGGPGSDFHARLNLTGDFTYATDTHYDLSLPAGEFNLEPQIFSSPSLVLGYLGEIVYDDQRPYDDPKRVVVGYQLRTWLHGEYGTISTLSEQVPPPANDFARIGPVVQLQLQFPTFLEGLILRVEYHFLPTLSGREGHDSLLKAGPTSRSIRTRAEHVSVSRLHTQKVVST